MLNIKSSIIIIKLLYNKQDEGVILEIDGEEVAMRGTQFFLPIILQPGQ